MFMTFFFFLNHATYEIMWKNTVQPDRQQMTIWHMCIACWITKPTLTHSEQAYVTLIAFPLQKWLHERTSMLHLSTHCLHHVSSGKSKFVPDEVLQQVTSHTA